MQARNADRVMAFLSLASISAKQMSPKAALSPLDEPAEMSSVDAGRMSWLRWALFSELARGKLSGLKR